jgi:hypothetical protein
MKQMFQTLRIKTTNHEMRVLNYTFFLFSFLFLYYFSYIAYDRSVRITPIDQLPLFSRQPCTIKHIEMMQEDNSVHDLSIYYSGVKKNEEEPVTQMNVERKSEDEKIQQEILKIVKEKQTVVEEKKTDVQKDTKVTKALKQPKKQEIVKKSDDTFLQKKKKPEADDSFRKNDKKSVFDVID